MATLSSLSNKTVLVTGASGFIGTHLVERLSQESGLRLILLSRRAPQKVRSSDLWLSVSLHEVSPESWSSVGVKNIDLVFHLGAFIPKSSAEGDRVEDVFRDNLKGTKSLLESLPTPPERIIFSSTVDVYAEAPEGEVIRESSPVAPSNLYGASKLFCEQMIRTYAREHGCDYAILRYGHIFGPGEEAYKKLIPQTIRQLLLGDSPVLYGDGLAERDFLYVEDAIEATIRAAISSFKELGPTNIVSGESHSLRNIVSLLIKMAACDTEIKYLANLPRGRSLRFDNTLMRKFLGAWDFVDIAVGLEREVEYFRAILQ